MIEDIKKIFAELVAIDSPSLHEREIATYIKKLFRVIGVELHEDNSMNITGSNTGNLYGYIKGNGQNPILLSVHMDTVMPAIGKKAIFHPDGKVTSDGNTVLGADDLAGITSIYQAVRFLKKHNIEHRDIELLFTCGEELYCKGAKAFDYSRIKSKYALVLDLSGDIGEAAYAAPTIISFDVSIYGKSAHAGFCPEEGINAIKIVCEAISSLQQGHIDYETTANIGMISGGNGINIVPKLCEVKGEIRSLNHEKALEIINLYKEKFNEIALKYGAKIEWNEQIDISAYETDIHSEIVEDYKKACINNSIVPKLIKTFGGSDNNVFAQNGIKGIVIATSMNDVHGCQEYTNVHEIAQVIDILTHICSG